MKSTIRVALVIAFALLVSPVSPVLSAPGGKVLLKGSIAPPTVTQKITLQVEVFQVRKDDFGSYLPPAWTDRVFASYDPQFKNVPATFELSLEPEKDYEFRVDVLDDAGNPLKDKTYVFGGPNMQADNAEQRAPVDADNTAKLMLPLEWTTRKDERSNFIAVVAGQSGTTELVLYFAPTIEPMASK